jgi:hypothetical protein
MDRREAPIEVGIAFPTDPLRLAYLKRIVARYGAWYLLRLDSGVWHISWFRVPQSATHLQWVFENDQLVDGEYNFASREEALSAIIKSLDIQNEAGYDYRAERDVAMRALTGAPVNDELNSNTEFVGSGAERDLLRDWMDSDAQDRQYEKQRADEQAAYGAACLEQEMRERVFQEVVRIFGSAVTDEINAAISTVWRAAPPTSPRTAGGVVQGDTLPMPQLAIHNEKVVFVNHGRASPTLVRTPLSKRHFSAGHAPHWQNPSWLAVLPAVGAIIERYEVKAKAEGSA